MNKFQEIITSDIEKFKIVVNESNGKGEICRKYNFCDNGKVRKIIQKFIDEYKLNISHFGMKSHPKKYKSTEKICPVCKNSFSTQINHPREKFTCSYKCSNTFFSNIRHTKKSKEKLSNTLKKLYDDRGRTSLIKIVCVICGEEKMTRKKTQKCCSNKCSSIFRNQNPTYKQHLKEATQRSLKSGTHKPWKPRSNPSYPEKFFMEVLKNNNIEYKHDEKCGKYYIDFAIENKKIALEIDGKQHKYTDRMIKDIEKNKYLTEVGWKVYRIDWNSINKEDGKKLMKEKIDKFLDFLNK